MHLDVDGATIHYERHGSGRPLLWVHGFLGAGSDWRHQFAETPRGYELIVPDLRGHGASSWGAPAFSFRQASRDLLALTTTLGITRLAAIGISGGGIALLHLALLAPTLLDAMVLVSVPPRYPDEARAIQRAFSPSMLPADELSAMRQKHAGGDAQVDQLFAYARAFADDRDDVNFTADRLAALATRTLLVFGDRDPFYPLPLALEMLDALPHASLWVVPGAGHSPVFGEHAARFRDGALDFLAEEQRPAS